MYHIIVLKIEAYMYEHVHNLRFLISSKEGCYLRKMKKNIVGADSRLLLAKCAEKDPMIATKVVEHP